MKVALIQFNATPDKDDNLRRSLSMTVEAGQNQAGFVLLPEIFHWRGNTAHKEKVQEAAERIPGKSVSFFLDVAQKHRMFVLLGSMFEKCPRSQRVYNTSILINPEGKVQAKYRKINLFDARIGDKILREGDCFSAGRQSLLTSVGPFKVGLSICYDLRFGALYQNYASRGAQILTVPACFTAKTGEAHWEVLLRARAIENLCYVLAPNQVGEDARGITAYGNSMIITPWGQIQARASADREQILYGQLDIEEVRSARQKLPGIIQHKGDVHT